MKKLFDSMQEQEHFGVWRYYHLGIQTLLGALEMKNKR